MVGDHRLNAVTDRRQIAEQLRGSVRTATGVFANNADRIDLYCGVCAATAYVMPIRGSSQKFGCTCALEESETKRLFDTSRCGQPDSRARVRSTSRWMSGPFITWWTWKSTTPGTPVISRRMLRAIS